MNPVWRRKVEASVGDTIFNEAADYDVTVEASAGVIVFASGVSSRKDAAQQTSTFSGNALRDFAIIAGRNLRSEQVAVGPTIIQSVFLPEHERVGKRVLAAGANALRLFNSRPERLVRTTTGEPLETARSTRGVPRKVSSPVRS